PNTLDAEPNSKASYLQTTAEMDRFYEA
nr:hypothetical protein [Tanacetum cinerariifolium]